MENNKKRNILLISAIPVYNLDSGSKKRIYNLIQILKKEGHNVYFLICNNITTMDKYRIQNFLDVPIFVYKTEKTKLLRRVAACVREKVNIAHFLDERCPMGLEHFVSKIQKDYAIDTIIVEYVFLSRALVKLENNVLKVIDTIDRVSYPQNKKYNRLWMRKSAEKKGLNRADIIWAIQDEEKEYFSRLLKNKKRIYTVGDYSKINKNVLRQNKTALIVASNNEINIKSVNWFLDKIWTKVCQEIPESSVKIVGGVGKYIKNEYPDNVCILNYVDDISTIYYDARVVINPTLEGTGLAIKTIEALAYTKPVVATEIGARGLQTAVLDGAIIKTNTEKEVINEIVKILKDDNYANELSKNAHEFIVKYNEEIVCNIRNSFINRL